MTRAHVKRPAAALVDDGYAVLPGFLDPAELDPPRVGVDRVLESETETCARPNNSLVPLRWDAPLVSAVLGDPGRIRRLADALEWTDPRWISGYVSVKPARSLALWWHHCGTGIIR